jgi:hypothetical protein
MIENRRIPWLGIGVLAVILMIVAALCSLCSPGGPTRPPCDAPTPPVVVPSPDAGVPDDGGSPCDAAPAPPIALDAGFDAGPSCGTHPWCPHPKPCCRDERDCCSS